MAIGADIVYRENDFGDLLKTLGTLGAQETLIAAGCREQAHLLFARAAEAKGWQCERLLKEGGTPSVQIFRLHAPGEPDGSGVLARRKPNTSAYGPWRRR